jgi:cell division protein ZapA
MIHQFEENYAVRDKQDVLAMCALQFASQNEQRTIDTSENYNKAIERLIKLDEALDRILSK